MMGCISAIDHTTRVEVQELLSRYCHYLDHDRGACWAQLFASDGVYEDGDGLILRGHAELQSMPGIVARDGGGLLRHIVSSIIVERAALSRDLIVSAYGPVMDMRDDGIARFYDYKVQINRTPSWRISRLVATRVGRATPIAPALGFAEMPLNS